MSSYTYLSLHVTFDASLGGINSADEKLHPCGGQKMPPHNTPLLWLSVCCSDMIAHEKSFHVSLLNVEWPEIKKYSQLQKLAPRNLSSHTSDAQPTCDIMAVAHVGLLPCWQDKPDGAVKPKG